MASQALERLIERAVSDEAFAARLRTDLHGVISEYNLSEEERSALTSNDPARMRALGVDARITKKIKY